MMARQTYDLLTKVLDQLEEEMKKNDSTEAAVQNEAKKEPKVNRIHLVIDVNVKVNR